MLVALVPAAQRRVKGKKMLKYQQGGRSSFHVFMGGYVRVATREGREDLNLGSGRSFLSGAAIEVVPVSLPGDLKFQVGTSPPVPIPYN